MHKLGTGGKNMKQMEWGLSGLTQGNQWIKASSSGSKRLLPTEWEGIRSCKFSMVKAITKQVQPPAYWPKLQINPGHQASYSSPAYLATSIYIHLYLFTSIYLYISTYILSKSIYIYLHHYLFISIYLYLSLSVSIYLHLSLSLSLSISIYLYLCLSISIYLSLSISVCLSALILAFMCELSAYSGFICGPFLMPRAEVSCIGGPPILANKHHKRRQQAKRKQEHSLMLTFHHILAPT